jgi:hypothetical protein
MRCGRRRWAARPRWSEEDGRRGERNPIRVQNETGLAFWTRRALAEQFSGHTQTLPACWARSDNGHRVVLLAGHVPDRRGVLVNGAGPSPVVPQHSRFFGARKGPVSSGPCRAENACQRPGRGLEPPCLRQSMRVRAQRQGVGLRVPGQVSGQPFELPKPVLWDSLR